MNTNESGEIKNCRKKLNRHRILYGFISFSYVRTLDIVPNLIIN